jgi:hypothetical protein
MDCPTNAGPEIKVVILPKHRLGRTLSILIVALLVLIPTCLWLATPTAPTGTASLILIGVTNNASGQRVALFSFTNGSSVSVVASSSFVHYKQGDMWVKPIGNSRDWEFVPGTYSLGNDLAPHKSQPLAIHFPTNAVLKFSLSL